MISNRFCANGLDGGMRVEISTVPATHNVILFADTESNHIIGCCELHVDGSLTMCGDIYIPMNRINDRMPVRHINQLALVLGVRGFINITIVDLERGYDEDIIRHKTAGKGLFVPNRYVKPTPSAGREKQFGLAMAPESIKLPTEAKIEPTASHSAQEVDGNQTVDVNEPVDTDEPKAETSDAPIQGAVVEPAEVPPKCSTPETSFDEWADDTVPLALCIGTGHVKASSSEMTDSD